MGPQGAESPPSQGAQAARGKDPEEVGRSEARYRYPRAARLRRESDIRRLFRKGERRRTEHLDVFVTASPALRPRVGLVVPKHGRAIVERNRLKRRLREAVRLYLLPRCRDRDAAVDVLIRAGPTAYTAERDELRREIEQLAEGLCSPES